MNTIPSVSIIFATYKRPDLLTQTLDSLEMQIANGYTHEIIAVDNCPEQSAKKIIESYTGRLPIQYLSTSIPGKNSAINLGLGHARGELFVFIDDDIIADPNWLDSLVDAAERYPEADIFGGKILPKYPDNFQLLDKRIDFNNGFVRTAYGEADWSQPEGPIVAERIWGANMMVRKTVFTNDFSFNPGIGPNGQSYAMGSETEFLLRAYEKGHMGVYVPDAIVLHHVRKDQISLSWLTGRAQRLARGRVQMKMQREKPQKTIGGVPRYLYKNFVIRKLQTLVPIFYSKEKHFVHLIELNKLIGEISQYRIMQKTNNPQIRKP